MGAKFTWFEKFSATLEKIPEDMRGTFALAMIDYGVHEAEPSFGFPYDAIFESVREDIDHSRKARTENGGGRPRKDGAESGGGEASAPGKKPYVKSQKPPFSESETPVSESGNPIHSNTVHNNTVQDKRGTARKRFVPPTVDEVAAYVREKGLARVDPESFCDFYASKGWRVGTQPMRDWKAAARNWDRRETKGGASDVDLGRYSKPEGEAF